MGMTKPPSSMEGGFRVGPALPMGDPDAKFTAGFAVARAAPWGSGR